jgi:hypothetical protein
MSTARVRLQIDVSDPAQGTWQREVWVNDSYPCANLHDTDPLALVQDDDVRNVFVFRRESVDETARTLTYAPHATFRQLPLYKHLRDWGFAQEKPERSRR